MDFDYERERLDAQVAYYEAKSLRAKRSFYGLTAVQLIVSTLVTALAAWPEATVPRPVLALLSAAAALAAGFLGLLGAQQQWTRSRATAEALKQEKYLHRAKAGPYAAGSDALLAERCEAMLSSEHSVWATAMEHAGGKAVETAS